MKTTKSLMVIVLVVVMLLNINVASVFATNSEPKVYSEGTHTLNLEGEFTASGYDAAIYVHSGAKLTINGEGKVHALADNGGSGSAYSTAVWVNGEGSEITINGGTYTNQGVEGDDHFDLIYAKEGGKIVINGGTFKCATPKWTLNLHDTKVGEIVVKGGTFYKFNPAEAETEPGGKFNFVAPGYSVVKNGDWYTVCEEPKVYSEGTHTLNLEGEFTASGYDAAIYVHSGAKLTINGEGKVHAVADNAGTGSKYSTAVWVNGEGSEITINGGTYTNQGVEGDDHFDLLYAKEGGKIVINGGTFKCATPKWTLNLHDTKVGEIIVKGGTFYKFNPAEAETEPGGIFNFVAPGYRVIEEGDWYTVCEIKDTEAEVSDKVANAEKVEEMVLETLKEAVAENSELAEAIKGKSIEIEVEFKPVEINESEKETIEKEAAKKVEDIKVAEYIDISIVVKDADTNDEIAKLSTVKEAIEFTVEVPSELKADIPEGYTRIFYIIRNHNGVIDVLETEEVDGKLSFETDKFSTYAMAYKDVKEEQTIPPTNEGGEGDSIVIPPSNEGEEDDSIVAPPTDEGEKEDSTVTPPIDEGETGKGEEVVEPEVEPEVKPVVKPEAPEVPKTGDNVVVFAIIAIVAMVGIVSVIKMRKK